jgi:hypothetical protein
LWRQLAVGFGDTIVTKDGQRIWHEMQWPNRVRRLRSIERLARLDPDHDWQVYFYGPLSESRYQRHGHSEWLLINKGQGFA